MSVYYNEHDAQKAAWLRELMRRNLIAPGEVDERSIEIVDPDELRGFAQCHFFAGIGVWSYALRNAGWSDSSPVWTGSCPCPSFSQSGKGEGFDDPRHLWPAWFRLLRVCRPDVVFGEQVASDSALSWLDLVSSDLEGEGYAIGAADLCAAGVGAPHIRQRLYFVADTNGGWRFKNPRHTTNAEQYGMAGGGSSDLVGDPQSERCGEARAGSGRPEEWASDASEPSELGHTNGERPQGGADRSMDAEGRQATQRSVGLPSGHGKLGDSDSQLESAIRTIPDESLSTTARNPWSDVVWLPCRDGKARPVEPGTFPLAHGAPARVVRLRGYGDAIVAPLAQAFIEAYQQVRAA